jgi:hypothetical protein
MKFTTVKQVKEALRTQRQLLIDKYTDGQGRLPFIYAETMDGNHGRIYHLTIPVKLADGTYTFARPFEEFTNWIQGGLPKAELLNWANETFN